MNSNHVIATLKRGAVAGMLGGAVMAMFAMVASATYQDGGFFTPLFHISALTGTPASMMTSMMQAAEGNTFWFTPGAAVVGMVIHLLTGAAYGMGLALLLRAVPRALVIPASALGGVAVFALSSFVGLPVAASITGAGSTISDMAEMVGYGTFLVEHVLFGLTVGVIVHLTSHSDVIDGSERQVLTRA
jgi:hypothetical protein